MSRKLRKLGGHNEYLCRYKKGEATRLIVGVTGYLVDMRGTDKDNPIEVLDINGEAILKVLPELIFKVEESVEIVKEPEKPKQKKKKRKRINGKS